MPTGRLGYRAAMATTRRTTAGLVAAAIALAGCSDAAGRSTATSSPPDPVTSSALRDSEPSTPSTPAISGPTSVPAPTSIGAPVAPPITDPVIEVVQPGSPEFVGFEGEADWAARQQTGVIRPEFVNEPKDISFLFTPPEQWVIDQAADMCGWAASTAFADQCVSLGVFQPGIPWAFPASSVGDDVFELWLTGWEWGRRLIVIDATTLEPGAHTIELRDPNATIDDILTTPPGDDGNYAVLR